MILQNVQIRLILHNIARNSESKKVKAKTILADNRRSLFNRKIKKPSNMS